MKYLKNKKGQGMVEYALIAAGVVTLAAILIKNMNGPMQARINDITKGLSTPVSGN